MGVHAANPSPSHRPAYRPLRAILLTAHKVCFAGKHGLLAGPCLSHTQLPATASCTTFVGSVRNSVMTPWLKESAPLKVVVWIIRRFSWPLAPIAVCEGQKLRASG